MSLVSGAKLSSNCGLNSDWLLVRGGGTVGVAFSVGRFAVTVDRVLFLSGCVVGSTWIC